MLLMLPLKDKLTDGLMYRIRKEKEKNTINSQNMININNARMSLLCNPGGEATGSIACSPEALCAMDTQMEINALTNSLQYQYAKAMLEQIKLQQKEDAKRFSLFA